MKKVLNNLFNIIDKIGKHNFILIIFIFIVFLVAGLYSTFSLHTSYEGTEVVDGDTTYKFVLNDENDTNRVTVAANSTKRLGITVANEEKMTLKYGVYYTSSDTLTDITVEYLGNVGSASSGVLYGNTKTIVIIEIENTTNSSVNIDFGILFGFESGGELILGTNHYWVVESNNSIKVTFNYNGGTETINSKGVFLENPYGELPTPVKNSITVQFDPQGGSITSGSSSASKTYTFNGWYSDSELTNLVTSSTIVSNGEEHTLYAKWTENNATITLPAISRSGYNFLGWYDSASGGTKLGDIGGIYSITTNTTLYAQWEELPNNSYSIVYNLNGGSKGNDENTPNSALIDSEITIANPTIIKTLYITIEQGSAHNTSVSMTSTPTDVSGTYTFSGWTSSAADGLNTSTAKIKTISSSYNETSWDGSVTKSTFFKNLASNQGTVKLTANWISSITLPTVSGRNGWILSTCKYNTASDGTGTSYNSGGTYTGTTETNVTLYYICN